jgi:hypothetical protein
MLLIELDSGFRCKQQINSIIIGALERHLFRSTVFEDNMNTFLLRNMLFFTKKKIIDGPTFPLSSGLMGGSELFPIQLMFEQ